MSRNHIFMIVAVVVVLASGVYGYLSSQPTGDPMTQRAGSTADATRSAASRAQSASSALPQSADYVKVSAMPRPVNGAPGGIDVTLDIARGWHVNANPASMEFLIPTTLKVDRGEKPVAVAVDYPRGHMLEEGFDKPIAVYSDKTVLPVKLRSSPADAPEKLTVKVNLQACNDTGRCLIPSDIRAEVGAESVP